MQKCPVCACENLLTSQYCERCGSPLKTSASTMNNEGEYTIPSVHIAPPPPPPTIFPTPQYSYMPTTTPSTAYTYQYPSNEKARPTRTIAHTVLSTLLYLIGASSTALGIFGGLQGHIGDSWAVVSMLSISLISIIVLVVVLIRHRLIRLRWWQRILLEIVTTGCMTLLTFIGYGVLDYQTHGAIPSTSLDILFGSCFTLYGLLVMFLALW